MRVCVSFAVCTILAASPLCALEVVRQGPELHVRGANFRYTWDTRRGGELAVVSQPGLPQGGWWSLGTVRHPVDAFQRVNSSFAWKLLDTIPALSFSSQRGAYFSLEWKIAYNSADRESTLTV